jgi:peptidyl-prolyl cis-trans isomerase SurA
MRRFFPTFAIAAIASLAFLAPAFAQNAQGIVAVVNDEVISGYDLDTRIRFTILSAQLPNRPEVYERLHSQVINNLIDDSLRIQEANRLNVQVTQQEIDSAKRTIEERNKMPSGSIDNFLTQNGVDRLTLLRQIKAEIGWIKIINTRIRPRIQIGDDEVREAMTRIAANKGKPEHLLSEIFLPLDPQTPESETKALADRLLAQLSDGANFGQLANTFSQSATAAKGGHLGWLRNDQLDDAIAPVVQRMEPGQVSLPIRALDGYHMVLLRDRRVGAGVVSGEVTVTLQQIFLPVPGNAREADVNAEMARAKSAAQGAHNCDDMARLGTEIGSPASGRLENVNVESLAPLLQSVVRDLPVGAPSEPLRSNAGIVVLMVCDRQRTVSDEEAEEAVRRQLILDRIDLSARRYLRNLRRSAFVEIRR